MAGLVCIAILLSGYHQVYDLSLLILPAVVVARGPPEGSPSGRTFRGVVGGLLLLLGANYLSSEGALTRLGLDRETPGWLVVTSLNAVMLLLAYVIYAAFLIQSWRLANAASGQDGRAMRP